MKIKQIKKYKNTFIQYLQYNDFTFNDYDDVLTNFVKFLELKNKERKCGTADNGGQLPMPPDLILVDLD